MSRDLLDLVRELNTLNDDNLADRVIENSDVQWCLSELQDILEAMPTLTPPNEPLTIEQLREMDGQPVWIVEAPYWGNWELSEDAEDYIIDRHEEFYGLKYNDPEGKFGLHKLGWLAYAYPPAHIRKLRQPAEED